MNFVETYLYGLLLVWALMTLLWCISVAKKDAGIADIFWGAGFVILAGYYLIMTSPLEVRSLMVFCLAFVWGIRLSVHIFLRNRGKGEDYRYKQFRERYGKDSYWWISYFQVFMLQGLLMWLVSAPLLGAMANSRNSSLNLLDLAALLTWAIGFAFEAGGDYQLARFKSDPSNQGKLLTTGFWKYTRHPNYFGDAAAWWGFGLFAVASGSYGTPLGSVLMTLLLIKVSGVAMLERSLRDTKPGYGEYVRKTNAFIPWFPRQ